MGNKVTFDYSKAANVVGAEEVAAMEKMVETAKEVLVSRTGLGNDFLGWIDWFNNFGGCYEYLDGFGEFVCKGSLFCNI